MFEHCEFNTDNLHVVNIIKTVSFENTNKTDDVFESKLFNIALAH